MAIKGKSKSRGTRTVARGPKPVYTPVRRPLLQRRGFWIGVLVAVGVVTVAGLAYGFIHQHDQNQARAEEQIKATVMRRYSTEVEPILQAVGQPVPPGNTFKAFPELTSALDGLASGDVEPASATTTATQTASSAKSAAAAISKVNAVGIVGGKTNDPSFVQYVIGSKDEMAAAMRLYEQVAELTKAAAGAPVEVRPGLVTRAQALVKLAGASLNRGYDWYVQAQSIAGTFQPTPIGATGLRPTGASALTGSTGVSVTTGATGATAATGASAATGSTPNG